MPVTDAQIVKKEPTVIPFEDATDDHVLSMVNILSDQWDSINGLKDSINKSVVPLLVSIERNTKLIDPVKAIRKKIRADKVVSATASDDYKVPVPRTTSTLKPAPWGRPGVDSSVQVTPDKAVPTSPAQKAEILRSKQTDIISKKDTENLVDRHVDGFKNQESLKTKDVNRENQSSIEKKADGKSAGSKDAGSKDAANEARRKKEKKQQVGLADRFKDAVSGWNGDVISRGGKSDDLQDVAGSATGGVLWTMAKELNDVAGGLNESNDDDKSLSGVVKKILMDKTGITNVKEKASSAKKNIVERVKGFGSKGEKAEPLPKGHKKDKNGRLRNEKGHYVTGPEKTVYDSRESLIERPQPAIPGKVKETSSRESDKASQTTSEKGHYVTGPEKTVYDSREKSEKEVFSRIRGNDSIPLSDKSFAEPKRPVATPERIVEKSDEAHIEQRRKEPVTGPGKTLLNQAENTDGDQVDAIDGVSDTLKKNEQKTKKRHEDLLNTVADAGANGGSGLFSEGGQDLFNGGGNEGKGGNKREKGGIRRKGKGGRIGKLLSKAGGKLGGLGKLGGIATAVLGGGLGLDGMFPSMLGGLGGLFGNGAEDESPSQNIKRNVTEAATEKATDSVSNRIEKKAAKQVEKKAASKVAKATMQKTATKSTSKVAGLASKIGGKGMLKAVSGASKMLKVLGPVAAIATAGFDAYQGYNDKEMQSKAFGLKEGEEATGGQKTSSAVANVLDMGGLISGGLSMLGADIETADIAKGIYEFFGGKNDKAKIANEAQATIQKKERPNPESIQKITETVGAENAAELINSTQPSIDKLAKQVEKLALSLDPKKSIMGHVKKGMKEIPQIMTEFDDSTLTLMAHDRI